MRHRRRWAALLATGLLTAGLLCALGGEWIGPVEARDLALDKELAEKARGYFDPEVEFLWRPRKEFLEALAKLEKKTGVDPLADLPLLRGIIYQGRHFLAPYDDRKWLSENGIDQKKKSGFYNLKSEEWRFTYTLPKSYPKKRDLSGIPRKAAPFPLLVSLHDIQDTRTAEGRAQEYPGMAVLERRFPKARFGTLYENWFTLAPVAARARFLEEDGAVRHLFLTAAITEFWRHYHVDFDRIVLDGGAPAAALAAVFPNIFAGLVLRGGPIEPELVKNYAAVPAYVVGDPDLTRALVEAGHRDVTSGDADQSLLQWLGQRRRIVPSSFSWRMTRADHRYANWITLISGAPERSLEVETDRDTNTVKIAAAGVEQIQVYLNDEIVDLDNEVTLVVNGKEHTFREERSFGQVFDKDPFVRRSMNFGWLFPVLLAKIKVPESGSDVGPSAVETDDAPDDEGAQGSPEDEASASKWFERGMSALESGERIKAGAWFRKSIEVGETSYKARAQAHVDALHAGQPLPTVREPRAPEPEPEPDPGTPPAVPPAPASDRDELRSEVQYMFLIGRLDRIDALLEAWPTTAEDWLPVALRDLWWRPTHDPVHEANATGWLGQSTGVVRDQYQWLLDGGDGPYPESRAPHQDPWPVITALVLERQMRETSGRVDLPGASPLASLTRPATWTSADWWKDYKAWFHDGYMRVGYEGEDPARFPAALKKDLADRDAMAAKVGTLSLWLSILAVLLFVGGVLLTGRLLDTRAKPD